MTDPRDQRRMLDALKEIEDLKQEIVNHKAVNSLLTDSDGEADLANKLFNLQDEMHKKEVAFKLITGQQYEEILQLKKALKEIERITLLEFYTEYELLQGIKNKLIELNTPEK